LSNAYRSKNKGGIMLHTAIRILISTTLVLTAAPALSGEERFPSRPIEVIVSFPPGGGGDIVARLLAPGVEAILGQRMVILNKPGAVGTIGQHQIALAKPDGHVIGLVASGTVVMAPHVMTIPYKMSDFAPVTQITESPIVFCSRSDSPMRDAKDLVAHARQHPDSLTYAANGVGGSSHLLGERIFQTLGIKLRLISYKGAGELVPALLGNQVDLYAGSIPSILPALQGGRARCLLLTTKGRAPVLPGVMSATDLGIPAAGGSAWHGIFAPGKTPRDRIVTLEKAFRDASRQKDIEKRFEDMGLLVLASSSEEFAQTVQAEYKAYADVVKKLGLDAK